LPATGLSVDARTAVWVCATVPGDVVSRWEATEQSAVYRPANFGFGLGELTVTARIANTGNLRQSGTARLTATGLLGAWRSASLEVEVPMLLPGQDIVLTQAFDGVPPALWADVTLEIEANPRDGFETAPTVIGESRVWLAPWIGLLVLALIAVAVWRLRTRRRRRRKAINRAVAARLAAERALAKTGSEAP
jgi:hypothetical protein